jgi:hypothetical protein
LRRAPWLPTVGALLLVACERQVEVETGSPRLDSAHAASMRDSVRAFANTVAHAVTSNGPRAWRTYFADEPAFFMASEGRLVFPNSDSASTAIQALTAIIVHIELRWGDSVRVDPLAPGLALLATPYHEILLDAQGRRVEEDGFMTGIVEHGAAGWQFRNAHWSVVPPAAAGP